MEWKKIVEPFVHEPTDDLMEAMTRVQQDDMSTGVIYQTLRPVWQPASRHALTLAEIEQELAAA